MEKPTLENILDLIDSTDPKKVENGLFILCHMQYDIASLENIIVKLLMHSESRKVRLSAIRCLTENPKPNLKNIFVGCLRDESKAVRARAMLGLERLSFLYKS